MSAEPQPSNGNGSVTFEKVREAERQAIRAVFGDVDDKELVDLVDHDSVGSTQDQFRDGDMCGGATVEVDADLETAGHEVVVVGDDDRGGAGLALLLVLRAGRHPRARPDALFGRQRGQSMTGLLSILIRSVGLGVVR